MKCLLNLSKSYNAFQKRIKVKPKMFVFTEGFLILKKTNKDMLKSKQKQLEGVKTKVGH